MSVRRKPVRQRDIVSFGRRTPRFNHAQLREEVKETSAFTAEFREPTPLRISPAKPRSRRDTFAIH